MLSASETIGFKTGDGVKKGWREEIFPVATLLALSAFLIFFQLGEAGLIDPDEPFYSLTAKEMLSQHELSTPLLFGKPQFEKPILFYWVIYGFFRSLGVSEFAARLGPGLAGISIVLITYFWAYVLFRRKQIASLSAVVLAASAQFVILSRIVLTDIFLCLFVTAALFCFSLGKRYPKHRLLCWNLVFTFSALGFLTKGPLGFMIPFTGILFYAWVSGEQYIFRKIPWISGIVLFMLIGFPWYALMTWKYGSAFLRHFFVHENLRRIFVAEHAGCNKLFFYPLTLFAGFFPWSGFLIPGLIYAGRSSFRKTGSQESFLFLFISFSLPFLFFITAQSKLMSYIFPLYPMVAILMGAWMFRAYRAVALQHEPKNLFVWLNALVWGSASAAFPAVCFLFGRTNGLHLAGSALWIAVAMIPFSGISIYLFAQKKYPAAFSSMILLMFFLTGVSFGLLLPQIEPVISSKKWAEWYQKTTQDQPNAYLLISKMYVRGLSFYTGNPNIGVFSDRQDGDFYTRPPIRIVSDAKGLLAISSEKFPVYFLLRKKEWEFLKSMVDRRAVLTVLENRGQQIAARLDQRIVQ